METQQQLQDDQLQTPHCQAAKSQAVFDVPPDQRRSANYKPSIWKYDFLESLNSTFDEKEYRKKAEKLIKGVKGLLIETEDLQAKLELIDSIRKLGLNYHFEEEIKKALDKIASCTYKANYSYPFLLENDLYVTALCFRILRLQGYQVSQDMYCGLPADKKGVTKRSSHEDVRMMLELLEASHVALECENFLQEAKAFATEALRIITSSNINNHENNTNLSKHHVVHALEIPTHWRVSWFDVKWQMNSYERGIINNHLNTLLLDLAKLNFNIVQATLQKDLLELSRWWKNLGLIERLNFARDRLVESFMCTVGLAFQPQYKCLRKCLTKVVNFILIVDDVYDLYGSLEELEHFTNAVDRWDVKEIEQLPDCMKICFQALYNTTCEIANEIETENVSCKQVLPHLQKVWADFCKSLFVEAKWYHTGYMPTFKEYLSNAWISSSGPLLLLHSFFSTPHEVGEEIRSPDFLEKNQDLVFNISLIIRLCNDIGTSAVEQERGDAPSSIVCYMQEMKVSEDVARTHIQGMIAKTWQKINKKCFTGEVPAALFSFIDIALNAARVAHSLYQAGDAFGVQVTDNKTQILSLLVEPLSTTLGTN
nr:terpene synthase [Ficus variegata var. variegata]